MKRHHICSVLHITFCTSLSLCPLLKLHQYLTLVLWAQRFGTPAPKYRVTGRRLQGRGLKVRQCHIMLAALPAVLCSKTMCRHSLVLWWIKFPSPDNRFDEGADGNLFRPLSSKSFRIALEIAHEPLRGQVVQCWLLFWSFFPPPGLGLPSKQSKIEEGR